MDVDDFNRFHYQPLSSNVGDFKVTFVFLCHSERDALGSESDFRWAFRQFKINSVEEMDRVHGFDLAQVKQIESKVNGLF